MVPVLSMVPEGPEKARGIVVPWRSAGGSTIWVTPPLIAVGMNASPE